MKKPGLEPGPSLDEPVVTFEQEGRAFVMRIGDTPAAHKRKLTPSQARQLAYALLLEAERIEAEAG